MKKPIILILLSFAFFFCNAQNISTVAGNGNRGYSGNAGAATASQINAPWIIAVDGAGNLYIADYGNNVIRKVNTSGIISTIAGNGTAGYNGDGGAATTAELNLPYGVAVDASGNVYIADWGNNVIREVNTSGTISTIAGNGTAGYSGDGAAATLAELNQPYSVIADASGNLYIADNANSRIRKVNTSGIISTFVGNGTRGFWGDGGPATAAEINSPTGLTFDGTGNIYIDDAANSRIRKVTTSGTITTVVGNGTPAYSGDGGQATAAEIFDPFSITLDASGNMYIADMDNSRIRKVNTSGIITTIAGNGIASYSGDGGQATAAELQYATGVAVDGPGNVYIADKYNNRIRAINTSGVISTFAGNGISGYSGDNGMATSSELYFPNDVVVDASGNLYIADTYNDFIRRVNTSGVISTIAGNGTFGYSGDGGQATAAELQYPTGVVPDGSGNFYIADGSNSRIRKVTGAGIINTVAGNGTPGYSGDGGQATAAELQYPEGIALDVSGNMYIADADNNCIRKVNTSGIITTIAGNNTYSYSGDGGQATAAGIGSPYGVAVDKSGNLYIADVGYNVVRKVNTSGIISTVAGDTIAGYSGDGGQATAAELNSPNGVAVDNSGNIYIADDYNFCVRMVNTSGVINTIAGNNIFGYSGDGGPATAAELNEPANVSVDASGNIFIADYNNNRIRKVGAFVITGLSKFAKNNEALVYPNPNNGRFTIKVPGIGGESSVEIYNMLGKKLYTKAIQQTQGDNLVDINGEPAGVYLYRILTKQGEQLATGKFIIQ